MKSAETEKSALQLSLKVIIYLTFGFSIAAVGAYIADLSINSVNGFSLSVISVPFAIVTAAFLLISLVLFILAKKNSGATPLIVINAVLFICCAITETVCAFSTRSNLKVLPTVFEILFFLCFPFLFKLKEKYVTAIVFYGITAIVGVLFMHVFPYKTIGLFLEAASLLLLNISAAARTSTATETEAKAEEIDEDKPFTVPFYIPLIFVLLSIFAPVIIMFKHNEAGITLFSCLQALAIIIFYLSKNGSKHKIAEYIIFGISVLSNILTIIPYHWNRTPLLMAMILIVCNVLGVIYAALFFENKFKNNVTGIIVTVIAVACTVFFEVLCGIEWLTYYEERNYAVVLMLVTAAQYVGYIALSITKTDRVLKRKSAKNNNDIS